MGNETFEEFDAQVGNRKTGYYGRGVEMYTKRDGTGERVFCVKWFERNVRYPTHEDWRKAIKLAKRGLYPRGGLGSEWVEKRRLFPYSEEGLSQAIVFSESLEPLREAFWNRETDC